VVLWIVIGVVGAAALLGLAWWSSGRSRGRYRGSADHEIAKATGTAQGLTRHPPGSGRGF
jgi:hypothetical protein